MTAPAIAIRGTVRFGVVAPFMAAQNLIHASCSLSPSFFLCIESLTEFEI